MCFQKIDIFSQLTKEQMERLQEMSMVKRYNSGTVLVNPSIDAEKMFIIKSGRVRDFVVNSDGKVFTVALLGAGEMFGMMPMIGLTMHGHFAECIEDSDICVLDSWHIEKLLRSDVSLAVNMLQFVSRRMSDVEKRLVESVLYNLLDQVKSTLYRLSQFDLVIRITHEQLASLLGATREAVSRILSELAFSGIIKQKRGVIVVRDREALRI